MHLGAKQAHHSCTLYAMSRRRQRRRSDKTRRHLEPTEHPRSLVQQAPQAAPPPGVVIRDAGHVVRLAYTRSQAAQALGISRSTLRRLLPYVDTIEMPWGGKLIPVDELERLVAERRQLASVSLRPLAPAGRKPIVPAEVAERIRAQRLAGRSLRQIAEGLNSDRIPTAHGGERWWPSTVHALLRRGA